MVSQPQGYISSSVARDRGCGSMNAPWRIEAEPGQSVNVSLINYTPDRKARSGRCRPLGYIYDVAQNNNVSICDTATTHENVYVSISHIVDVQLITDIIEEHSFLLQYTGTYMSLSDYDWELCWKCLFLWFAVDICKECSFHPFLYKI